MENKKLNLNNHHAMNVAIFDEPYKPLDYIKTAAAQDFDGHATFVVDLDEVERTHVKWCTAFPRVKPFYAVKCNEDLVFLNTLAQLGVNFDCASEKEIKSVLSLGVSPNRIIFANPCKQISMLKYAKKCGVSLMTFDNEDELEKIKEYYPNATLVLRMIPAHDEGASYSLSKKFGADMNTSKTLIDSALKIGFNIIGVSFHAGAGHTNPLAYVESIKNARILFDYALEKHNHKFTLLDLGGGFSGYKRDESIFYTIANGINETLTELFPPSGHVSIIAEPGRYYCVTSFTLCIFIIAKRVIKNDNQKSFMYYVNDGAYNSFSGIFNDHIKKYVPILLKEPSNELFKSIIWGNTCCSYDVLNDDCLLPELSVGDYFAFDNFGAYTSSCSTVFNGMPKPRCRYIVSSRLWVTIKDSFNPSKLPVSIKRKTVEAKEN